MAKDNGRVLALCAHPDDIEILCGGTLALLSEMGYHVTMASMTDGDCGSTRLSNEEIAAVRAEEARNAAAIIGAEYMCVGAHDLRFDFDQEWRLRTTDLLRRADPFIVITHPPNDYMCDHEIVSRLVRDATFTAPVPNHRTGSGKPTEAVPYLYYCDPLEGIDLFGNPAPVGFYVDITATFDTKHKMLAAHDSQRAWLRHQHGIDEYLESLERWAGKRGQEIGVRCAESFRQHLGHSYPRDNVLGGIVGAIAPTHRGRHHTLWRAIAYDAIAGLLLGLILLTAIIGGSGAHLVRLPRVVGYLLAGIALKYALHLLLSRGQSADPDQIGPGLEHLGAQLRPLTDWALGLILFAIGGIFDRAHLRAVGRRVLRISAAETGLTAAMVLVACWIVSGSGMVAWFMAAMAVATAPAATLLVVQEYEAKGPNADRILTLTGLNNIWSIVLFHLVFLMVGYLALTEVHPERSALLDLIFMTVGSAAVGIVLGLFLSIMHSAASSVSAVTLFLATIVSLAAGVPYLQVQHHLAFNYLLICLAMGATFANEAINPDRLNSRVASVSGPIFAGFFVLAGYNLHIEKLSDLGVLGAAYCLMRVGGKLGGAYLGLRWARAPEEVRANLGQGLLCQAGVAIGLATYLRDHLPGDAGHQMNTVILGSVTIFELIGPLLVKNVLVRAGEVKAISLMARPSAIVAETTQVAGLIVRSLLRLLHARRKPDADSGRVLQVRHIMRSNIKSLAPAATLRDVMHFVERSRFHEFPVADTEGRLIGVIDYADIREMIYDPFMRDLITAVDLADTQLEPAVMDQSLNELLERFSHLDTSCLPVVDSVDSRRLVGIVEQRDLLQALH